MSESSASIWQSATRVIFSCIAGTEVGGQGVPHEATSAPASSMYRGVDHRGWGLPSTQLLPGTGNILDVWYVL